MPVCKKCNSKFKDIITVDGKRRYLTTRKYCLICSPFNEHRNNRLELEGTISDEPIICKKCKKPYIYERGRNRTHELCSDCIVERQQKWKKVKAVEYKGGECYICGYNKCIQALQFHHVNPKTKCFLISGSYTRSWEAIKNELDKCVLLCSNCHAEVEDGIVKLEMRQEQNIKIDDVSNTDFYSIFLTDPEFDK